MRNLNSINLKTLTMLSLLGAVDGLAQEQVAHKIALHWRPSINYNGKDNLGLEVVIKNNSEMSLDLSTWDIWFNSMFPALAKKSEKFSLYDHTGNLFRIELKDAVILPQDSIVIDYDSKYPIANISTAPNGFYIQHKTDLASFFPLENISYQKIALSATEQRDFYARMYDKNELLNKKSTYSPIFPTPFKLEKDKKGGHYLLKTAKIYFSPELALSRKHLGLSVEYSEVIDLNQANIKVLFKRAVPKEGYTLDIGKKGVVIEASDEQGAFYALQSLNSLFPVDKSKGLFIPYLSAEDKPRYGYRGLMMDISRNFRDKEVIKKYLDLMASYKLNVFHFHFIDDEGWRIEIPSLPELSQVGARRSPLFQEGNALPPAYGSGATDTPNLFLTRTDFIEILQYAHARHITVVPEIETPGHARASIKAMEQRYREFMKLGNRVEAERYLLHDIDDTSVYNSAQNWTDNILNPALPSVYTFIDKVVDEFVSMYKDAGLELKKVSIGGDEVPNGVWEKSPKIQALMKAQGMSSVYEVWPYYISKVNDILKAKGLETAGWEEIGMVNQGKGMTENPIMANKQNMQVDVWNNMIGGGQEDLAYRLANAGYKTVLISASNMYFDMMWDTSFDEPGLKWATYADLYHSYSLLPEVFFANIDTYYSGKKLGKGHFKDKVRLTAAGKANLIGIKGGLWAETIHSEEKLDYMVFPRFFALAEKAWSPERSYESENTFTTEAFNKDYTTFINKISADELPKIASKVKFRLPAVGLKLIDDKVYANLEYPGFTIYYTVDGTIPTKDSLKYTKEGLPTTKASTVRFAVLDEDGRVGPISTFTK